MRAITDRHEDAARVHAALAEPIRVAIAEELMLSDRTPSELQAQFGLPSNLLAHHLDVLGDAGLVVRTVSHGDRRRRYLRLRPERVVTLIAPAILPAAGIVFVCTRNSARSQLAAALWQSASQVPAASAGTDPADGVHPGAVAAAARRGLNLRRATPCRFQPPDEPGQLVVTVCDRAHESLHPPTGRDRVLLHWSIPDPAVPGRPADFDAAVDAIATRVAALAAAVRHVPTTTDPQEETAKR